MTAECLSAALSDCRSSTILAWPRKECAGKQVCLIFLQCHPAAPLVCCFQMLLVMFDMLFVKAVLPVQRAAHAVGVILH